MPDVPFFEEFPDLPPKLQQIAGSDYRAWRKSMEEWIIANQTASSTFTNTTIEQFFSTLVQADKVFLPKYCSVGLFDPNDGYESTINGETTILQQFGKFLAIERDYNSFEEITSGDSLFVARGGTTTGRAYLFNPPDDFWIPVVLKGIYPVRYPHFEYLTIPFSRGCVRTGFQSRMLTRGDFAGLSDYTKGISQTWYPGYQGKYAGNRVWLYSNNEADWSSKPIGRIEIGVNKFDVYDGSWFDLNVNGSSWKNSKEIQGYEFSAFPVNNFDPFPTGNFYTIPFWQNV